MDSSKNIEKMILVKIRDHERRIPNVNLREMLMLV